MEKKLSTNLIKITRILNDLQFHDGTSIGERLGVSRTAVWKTIKKLVNYHIPIQSLKGKGYALDEPLVLLDKNHIKSHLIAKDIQLDLFEEIDSTNEYVKSFCQGTQLRVCLAEQQTQGKARLHRQWHSPFGKNIYLSLLYPFYKDISALAGLSLVVGLSICRAIEKTCSLPANLQVKWPNDVMIENKKLAGTLIEIQAETHGLCHVIIGVGLNVNMMDDENTIQRAWTSLEKTDGKYHDRNPLCAALINELVIAMHQFEQHGLSYFMEEWHKKDALIHRCIELNSDNEKIQGEAAGINEQGLLRIKLADGSIRLCSSGDTTLQQQ